MCCLLEIHWTRHHLFASRLFLQAAGSSQKRAPRSSIWSPSQPIAGSCAGVARQVDAQGPHGMELGRQRLHHQRGPARRQRPHGFSHPVAGSSVIGTSTSYGVGLAFLGRPPSDSRRTPSCYYPGAKIFRRGQASPYHPESGNI